MSHARFTENETGLEVDVETVFSWGDENTRESIVSFAVQQAGVPPRRYHISQEDLALHFKIVTPQEIFITGYGGHGDRPSRDQKTLKAEFLALMEKVRREIIDRGGR